MTVTCRPTTSWAWAAMGQLAASAATASASRSTRFMGSAFQLDRHALGAHLKAHALLRAMQAKHHAAIVLHDDVVRASRKCDARRPGHVVACEVLRVLQIEHLSGRRDGGDANVHHTQPLNRKDVVCILVVERSV